MKIWCSNLSKWKSSNINIAVKKSLNGKIRFQRVSIITLSQFYMENLFPSQSLHYHLVGICDIIMLVRKDEEKKKLLYKINV